MTNHPQEPRYIPENGEPLTGTLSSFVAPSFNEAPAVIFTQLYTIREGQIVQFNLTVRAENGRQAIDELVESIAYAKDKYKLSLVRPDLSQQIPARQEPALQKPPALSAPQAPQSPAASGPALPPARLAPGMNGVKPGSPNVIKAVKLKVTPLAGDKAKLEWFGTGHNFSDLYATKTIEQWLNILPADEGWDAEYLAKVGEYTIAHSVAWVESDKLNTAGKPYKNISSITAG